MILKKIRVFSNALLGLMVVLATGCTSTIHEEENIGGIDTLSLDAKQRLMLVGNRTGEKGRRVTCTEPSPDALVARAAAMAAKGNAPNSGSGEMAGLSSESAASIGFRDHTVQLLRDGYFRLCEAYMNGVIDEDEYVHMIQNVDTFIVTVSALQILGSNPVAPAVAITTGGVSVGTKDGVSTATGTPQTVLQVSSDVKGNANPNENTADAAVRIVNAYLKYREPDRYHSRRRK
ncbi:MAG: hypothetical protein KJ558_04330 [Gammaproteobacteria bacterium]|nr:hypothetical protein [Gammaproteobacteria bacterium]MBU1654048.1 hypothetical protein [Gammaproteobacteria bacterium]MBU1961742.1 hypothetical protein [Gammaproteobacteria bacterium]